MRRAYLPLVLALACMPARGMAASAAEFDGVLKHAEAIRSTDPVDLASSLAKLDAWKDRATPTQQRQLRLLHAYRDMVTGRYEAAIKQALGVYDEATEPAIKLRGALLVANGAAITREFSLGMRYLQRGLELTDQISDSTLRHEAYLVAGVLYNQYGQFALGQHYVDQLLNEQATPRNRCIAKQLRVEAAFGLGESLDEAQISDGIADCSGQHETIPANLLRDSLARHWAAHGQKDKAIGELEAHLPEVEATGYPRLIGEVNGLLAEYRLATGDLAGASDHARRVLAKGEKDVYSLPLVTAHKVLSEVALKHGDLVEALGEYRAYAEADKARLDEIKAREFAFQLSRQELQQKNQAIQLLSKQNEVLRLQQEVTKQSARSTQLLIGLLAFLVVSLVYWGIKIKRTQKRFQVLAQTDALTGICNRAHLRQQAEAALAQCKARNKPVGMLVFDLDNFKAINDRHGHAGGDWILEQVARACSGVCREGELFGRLGGEEFGIVVPDRDLAATERVAEACRAALATIDTSGMGEAFTVTASFGCVGIGLAGYDYERLLALADEAMYSAKHGGRDCIRRYGDAPIRGKAAPVLVVA